MREVYWGMLAESSSVGEWEKQNSRSMQFAVKSSADPWRVLELVWSSELSQIEARSQTFILYTVQELLLGTQCDLG